MIFIQFGEVVWWYIQSEQIHIGLELGHKFTPEYGAHPVRDLNISNGAHRLDWKKKLAIGFGILPLVFCCNSTTGNNTVHMWMQ
jgi:hypothetical protein